MPPLLQPTFLSSREVTLPPVPRISWYARAAFSLIEMMLVIAVIAIIAGLVTPVLRSEKNASSAAYEVAGVFNRARAYAMARSAYVYVGVFEENGSRPPTAANATADAGVGRVVMAAVATKDGMNGYDESNKTWSSYSNGSSLVMLNKLLRFDSLSIAGTRLPNGTGGMVRPTLDANGILITGATVTTTPFAWPVGKPFGSGQYNFEAVVCFSPQGVARVLDSSHASFTSIPSYLEIDFLTAHGSVVASGSNVAAVQVDAMTGATRVYRP